jgi:glutathione S-transferase
MLIIHHFSLCPFSRKLRIILKEKGITHELIHEAFWQRNEEFLKLSPLCETPVISTEDLKVVFGHSAICEYIEEKYPHKKLYPLDLDEKAAVRSICHWFDYKLYNEVTKYLLNERIIKTLSKNGSPNSKALYVAKQNLLVHMQYIEHLLLKTRYLISDDFSMADISAAAQLSVIDYLGDINWERFPSAKVWYSLIKSRPSFRSIRNDRIPGITPPPYYADPDF